MNKLSRIDKEMIGLIIMVLVINIAVVLMAMKANNIF